MTYFETDHGHRHNRNEGSYETTSTTKKETPTASGRTRAANQTRKAQRPAEIVESVKRSPNNYKAQSDEVKRLSLQNSIDVDIAIMETVYQRGRVDLDNPQEVATQAQLFLKACKEAAVLPTFEKFCASLGYSRQTVYKYLRENPDTQSTEVIDHIRTVFTDLLQEQALQRNFAESLSIFLLKNARGQGYTDRPEEELTVHNYHAVPPIDDLIKHADLITGNDEDGLI